MSTSLTEPLVEPAPLVRHPRRIFVVSLAVCLVPAAALGLFLWHNHGLGGAGAGARGGGHPGLPVYLRLFFAVLAIGGLAHAGGWAARRLGQPGVVGEMIAGLLLGPSVLGRFLPGVTAELLPSDVRGHLAVLAQVGLVLFMFSVGAEFDPSALRRQGAAIGMLSQATMTVPFVLGLLLVPAVFPHFAGPGVGQAPFAVFLGTAISITAFPVLARIVEDAGLARTPLGNLAMVCAGIDDVLAWSALAVVLAVIQAGSPLGALVALPLAAGFAALVLFVVRPLLARGADRLRDVRAPVAVPLVAVLCLVFTLAGLTDRIGVHAIFGAFLAGIVLPRGSRFLAGVPERLGTLNRALLLPVFFASIGLQVDVVSAVGDAGLLVAGAVTILVAIGGKLGSAALCARAGGLSWRASAGLGVLLNARGITEIVVLQTGLAIGVINERAFTVLVFMALVTTVMTMPLLRLLGLVRPGGSAPTQERLAR
ncbi:cation:proton antiporter [Dactylosporangium sp. McL0621]|uniref:cation:proton antiporter n=1 Tax=Dactylosporangium sp. McL0621 TaxID=3415678 RepID=UPI003CE822FF